MKINRMSCTLEALVAAGKLAVTPDTEQGMFDRIRGLAIPFEEVAGLAGSVEAVGVTEEFRKVIRLFRVEEGVIPAGFRPELVYGRDRSMRVDLHRDIAFGENGQRRPGNVLFSANTANPFTVATMKNFIANLTTNPQIIYEHFLNNPKANKNHQFKDRFEVVRELGNLVGPGVDISVEVNDPFAEESALLEEIARFEEILTPYRLVVKVPHTGPLNRANVGDFLAGDYPSVFSEDPQSAFYGHNFAYKLQEMGYRVNFTLMSDPHQMALALLAKPYFINAFVERRHGQTTEMARLLELLDQTGEAEYRERLQEFMAQSDILGSHEKDPAKAEKLARELVAYRGFYTRDGRDGLDNARHALRLLKTANLPETRLIICNMKSAQMYYDIDKMLVEPEFAEMQQRVVVTCEPEYFARFTGSPTIYNYQRSFLNAVASGGQG